MNTLILLGEIKNLFGFRNKAQCFAKVQFHEMF